MNEQKPEAVASTDQLGDGAEARCMCKDRALSACPGEWEPGCDLGNNPAHVRAVDQPGGEQPPLTNRVTRSFAVRLSDGHPTAIEVVEYSNGDVMLVFCTERAGMEPLQTAVRLQPKTMYLLSIALTNAAHDSEAWVAA